MSPILKRLADLLGRAKPPADVQPVESEPADQRRRRRGGRGRGGSGGGNSSPAPSAAPPSPAARSAPAPAARAPDERARQPYGNSSYDRRRPRRNLDQPLPEDIAFRPPAEGGDRSILPSRRRPPPGLKATKRVLVTGHRFVPRGGPSEEDDDLFEEHEDNGVSEPVAGLEGGAPSDGTPTDGIRKRRRGRRGGRGRRRGGAGDESASAGDEG